MNAPLVLLLFPGIGLLDMAAVQSAPSRALSSSSKPRSGGVAECSTITREMIEAAAAAIANARAGRRGSPPISNVLETLTRIVPQLHDEVMEDAEAALAAALATGGARG